jgi:hypothetical protein
MKYTEFRDKLESIVCNNVNAKPTEVYLRKLLGQLVQCQGLQPSPELFIDIFESSLNAEPVEIEGNWYELKEPKLFSNLGEIERLGIDEFEYTINTIRFFVADLKRMEDKELKNPYKGYGVTSSSGARWYNFTMCGFVQASFQDLHERNDREMIDSELSWYYIASILIFGKMYE